MKKIIIITLGNARRGRNREGWNKLGLRSLNPSPPRPNTFAGRRKPERVKAGRGWLSEARQNCHPYLQLLVRGDA